ncbi:MAG: YraN family protein [Mycobacteriaceae bacterium]|uniref:YraN family protein n=1 Tax=Corynebacterium sp. TaxID=1720 RepID=UPI003F997775
MGDSTGRQRDFAARDSTGREGPRRNLREVGARGEDRAAEFFLDRGYSLLDRNFYTSRGEVDIVLRAPGLPGEGISAGATVFVEVKWRIDGRYGRGAEAVTPSKLKAMRHAGAAWLREHPDQRAAEIRFDVLDITDDEITHYEGIGW